MNTTIDNINYLLNSTKDLVAESKKFESDIINLFKSIDLELQNRVIKWIDFFNTNHFKNPCIYSPTIYAIIETVNQSEFIRNQTQYEFELSLSFYDKIYSSKTILILNSIFDAKILLRISLIYSKYYGLQQSSFSTALLSLKDRLNEDTLIHFFIKLFVRYENPYVLTQNFSLLSDIEIDALMYVLQGNNLRNFSRLDIRISSFEAHWIINHFPNNIKLKNNVLKRSAVIAKIASKQQCLIETFKFFNICKTFEYRLDYFIDEINFWERAYKLITEIQLTNNIISIEECVDYIEYKKTEEGDAFTLKGATIASFTRAVANWHQNLNFGKLNSLLDTTWSGTGKENYTVEFKGVKYLFTEIRTGKKLFEESNDMKHCAFSYVNSCINGFTSIWSMKKEINNIYKNYLTIEVKDNEIVQVRGKLNKDPSKNDLKIIEIWAKEDGYSFTS